MDTTAPPRLLIIDDDPKLAAIVGTIAREAYPDPRDLLIECIITAEAAILAIRQVSAEHDAALVVISDFHLPPSAIHGIDLLQEVKRRVPTAKRALMTGRDPTELVELLEDAHLDAFIAKPFTFDEMQGLVVRLVEEVASRSRERQIPIKETHDENAPLEL